MTDTERIENLESVVRALREQVAELRAEVMRLSEQSLARGARRHARAAEPAPAPAAAPTGGVAGLDLESLIGRYGTIVLATLATLTGAGAFLTWAIAHGLLGPVPRVVLGALGAAAVAAVGWRLRAQGTVRYGNVLLALALAIVHVDAWAAGPRLQLIPPVVALGIAAIASIALAALALSSKEELLFSVGLGGALLAPFVTSSGGGSALLLLSYGWLVIASGLFALRGREWRVSLRLTVAGCAVYAASGASLTGADTLERHLPVLFALACAWSALAWGREVVRARLTLAFLVVMLVALLPIASGAGRLAAAMSLALAGTITAYVTLRLHDAEPNWRVTGWVLLPLGFLLAALLSLAHAASTQGAMVAVVWTVVALLASWDAGDERAVHLFVAAIASGTAILLALSQAPARCIVALVLHSAIFATLVRRERAPLLFAAAAGALAIASTWSFALLEAREAYRYLPFLTIPSLTALACVLGWYVLAWQTREAELQPTGRSDVRFTELSPILAPLAAFVWVRQELIAAFAPDIATFFVIVYYALAGVGAIFVGRKRAHGGMRGAGLALAVYAGVKTLVQTWDVSSIGLRVASCILVSLFLAAVAYWYRAPDSAQVTAQPQTTGG